MSALKNLADNHDIGHLIAALLIHERIGGGFDCALDVGAHRGIWTRTISKYFKNTVAIEPQENNFEILNHYFTTEYGIGGGINHVECINAAAGAANAKCAISAGTENTGQYHVVNGDGVAVIAIDDLDLKPDFIKFDVEGYELFAMLGAEKTIQKHKPTLIIEMNGLSKRYGYDDKKLTIYLQSLGYILMRQENRDYIYAHKSKTP